MTNEEREALIAQGWTPPEVVDPDIHLAHAYAGQLFDFRHPINIDRAYDYFLGAIKRGRALAAAEAKPGLVWVKHEQSNTSPVPGSMVTVMFHKGHYETGPSFMFDWWRVDYYAIITPPTEGAA